MTESLVSANTSNTNNSNDNTTNTDEQNHTANIYKTTNNILLPNSNYVYIINGYHLENGSVVPHYIRVPSIAHIQKLLEADKLSCKY